ncbi:MULTISPECIES: 3'-5' exonuclease [Thermogemmatispora]|uniref:3'-5' exonuclease n=1 Tax=Thermogemmatispora TaxID=768669 RepID=UPI000A05DA87|nr:3'-5' exonuclease [Thermogemmatispora aurantia]
MREELARDIAIVDTETTGLPEDPGFQVGEIAVIDGKGKLLFRSLIQPDAPVTPGARALHGISDEALQHAPPLTERWGELCAVLEGCASIWAYNAEFDPLALPFNP